MKAGPQTPSRERSPHLHSNPLITAHASVDTPPHFLFLRPSVSHRAQSVTSHYICDARPPSTDHFSLFYATVLTVVVSMLSMC